jgi:hypothetical protein
MVWRKALIQDKSFLKISEERIFLRADFIYIKEAPT